VLGGKLDFSLYDPKFNAWVDQAGLMKAKEINDTTRTALREKLAAEVSEGVQSGESMSKIAARIREATDGVYENMSKNRARVIARTETMSSVNTGQFEVYKGEGVTKKEFLATMDDRTRDAHADANGQIVGMDEPFNVGGEELQYPGDPAGSAENVIQCFTPDTVVSGAFVAGSKMLYSGKIRVITTRSGKRLSVTINHPILTDAGFIKACDLKKGMNAVAYSGDIGDMARTNPNNKNGPAKICDVFDAIGSNGIMARKRSTALDFDGDGVFGKGDIEIVATSRKLAFALDPVEKFKAHDNLKLASSNPQPLAIGHDGSLDHFPLRPFDSKDSSMSGPNLPQDSIGVLFDFGPLKALGVGPASNWNPGFTQSGREHSSGDSSSIGDGLKTLAGKVGGNDIVPSRDSPSLLVDSGLSEPLKQDLFRIPGFLGKLANASSGLISMDEIIEIRDEDFSGHVYDLQSIDGYIMCNGIVSSNCRCTVLPVLEE